MVVVVLWLAVAVPRLMATGRQPSKPERTSETSPLDEQFAYQRVVKLSYFEEKEQRNQALVAAIKSLVEKHGEEDLDSIAGLMADVERYGAQQKASRMEKEEEEDAVAHRRGTER